MEGIFVLEHFTSFIETKPSIQKPKIADTPALKAAQSDSTKVSQLLKKRTAKLNQLRFGAMGLAGLTVILTKILGKTEHMPGLYEFGSYLGISLSTMTLVFEIKELWDLNKKHQGAKGLRRQPLKPTELPHEK